jgi:hypothetical protein
MCLSAFRLFYLHEQQQTALLELISLTPVASQLIFCMLVRSYQARLAAAGWKATAV